MTAGAAQVHTHFIGIGGSGMSSLAEVLLAMGATVSGSDLKESARTRRLAELGARVFIGHDARHLDGARVVVVSTAVPADNVELREARNRGLRVLSRGQLLARLMEQRVGIAVAGCHGKTTTASMIGFLLSKLGCDPTVVVGGEVCGLGAGGWLGRGPHLVAEADESDGSFLALRPAVAVVTNIDDDHLDHYGTRAALEETFRRWLASLPGEGLAVLNADDPVLRRLAPGLSARRVTYGLENPGAELTAAGVELTPTGSRSTLYLAGRPAAELVLSVPGRHNVSNALAALVCAREAGLPLEAAAAGLAAFRGARRRFERIGEHGGTPIYDDYAHHPTEIAATLAAARSVTRGRLVVLFQPHRYTRTRDLFHRFPPALAGADVLVLTEIYPALEPPLPGVSGRRLYEATAAVHPDCHWAPSLEEAAQLLHDLKRPGDLVLTMGAGDVWRAGVALASRDGVCPGGGDPWRTASSGGL